MINLGSVFIAMNVDTEGTQLGFFAAPYRYAATGYTQGYTPTAKALAAYTPNVQSSAFTGGLLDLLQAARLTDLNTTRLALENLRAFTESLAKQHNALMAELTSFGLLA